MFTSELLKPFNCCSLVGIESKQSLCLFPDVEVFSSNTNSFNCLRVVYYKDGLIVCSLLLKRHKSCKSKDYVVCGVYTQEDERQKGYGKAIVAVSKVALRTLYRCNLVLDGNFTESGKKLFHV